MKKIILAIVLTAGLFSGAFAGDDSINAHINNTLHLLFKITDNKYVVDANNYQQKTFVYNGMPVTVFKNKTSGWYGFYKMLSPGDLPENAVSFIKSKYKNCTIKNVTLYFNNEADLTCFAEIIVKNKCIVLKVKPSGSIQAFS